MRTAPMQIRWTPEELAKLDRIVARDQARDPSATINRSTVVRGLLHRAPDAAHPKKRGAKR